MDNQIAPSIGYRIGLQTDGRALNAENVFPIFIVVYAVFFVIHTVFDIVITIMSGNKIIQDEFTKTPSIKNSIIKTIFQTLFKKHKKSIIAISTVCLIIIVVSICYAPSIPLLQHYDFYSGQKFTVQNAIDRLYIKNENQSIDTDTPLIVKEKGVFFTNYRIAELQVDAFDGDINITPIFITNVDNHDEMFPDIILLSNKKIVGNDAVSFGNLKEVNYSFNLITPSIFQDVFLPFSLERSSPSSIPNSPDKLIFPLLFFCMLYFILLLVIIYSICLVLYSVILHLFTSNRNIMIKSKLIGIFFEWIKIFIVSTPIVIILAFLSTLFPAGNIISGIEPFAAFLPITNNIFINSIFSYIVFTLFLSFYIIPCIVDDTNNQLKLVLNSQEIKYQINIGNKDIVALVTKKYGINIINRMFMESLLFVLIIQFFSEYCLMLSQFIDYFGVSSVFSLENIFTKSFRAQTSLSPSMIFNFIFILIIYICLFVFLKRKKK
ncbi:MAG: hypothetical protein LBV69_05210 [Bacteroidales bacterium]|jgi:hypothetical protein|nr:hypothetical protein [Bacteroidales bacterium]